MRKWAFFCVAAAAVIIGCAGGGDSGTGSSATDGSTNTNATAGGSLRVNIPTPPGFNQPPGRLQFGFLTGQGRAIGDLTLVMERFSVTDEWGEVRQTLSTDAYLALGSYSFQTVSLTVPFNGQNSRFFESYTLDPTSLNEDTGAGIRSINCFAIDNGDGTFNRAWPPNPIQIEARVFPGRSTLLPIFIDDSMFSVQQDPSAPPGDPCNGLVAAFDEDRFLELNQPPIKGFINDYVEFDLSAMPADQRPIMSTGESAARVFVSGDNYAVSGAGASGNFEVLTLFTTDPVVGTFRVPSQLPGQKTPGTFTLEQLDPTDLFNLRKIVALQGEWKENETVLAGFGTWNMVAFPNSEDGFEQEIVMFKRDGNGDIVDFYYGFLNYDTDIIRMYPVRTLVTGAFDPNEETTLTITGQFDRSGIPTVAPQETRSGTFSVTAQGAFPGDAPSAGSFIVFRV